jgi:hypothetical protein
MNDEEKLQIIEDLAKNPLTAPEDVLNKIKELYGNTDYTTIRTVTEQINKKIINGEVN